jgi:excisionase family DNA binding protein
MKTDELLRRIKVILEENDKGIYSHKEAAEFLGVSSSYLEKLKSNYLIKFCRIGGKIVYRKIHLHEYLDRVTVRGPENDPGRQGVSYVRRETICGAT